MRILVTGGTGHLGRSVVARLRQRGHKVRVLARQPGERSGVEWARGDLSTGAGVAEAVEGVDRIVHAATNSPAAQRGALRSLDLVRAPTDVDVRGTASLVAAAERAGVEHLLHVSIVGLEHTRRLPYSRVKLEAERVVSGASLSWAIARATPFYWLLDRMFSTMAVRGRLFLPEDVRMQPCDADDFAGYVSDSVLDGRSGRLQDFAGPEIITMGEAVQRFLLARSLRRRVWNVPLPPPIKRGLERGTTTLDGRLGSTTWEEWLQRSSTGLGRRDRAA
jgi:uncharacterized protein YbjT (DUF2867 family)